MSFLQKALGDLAHWRQLLVLDLSARAVTLIVVTPVLSLLLKLFLMTADEGVVTDVDIARFALHPLGALAFLLIAVVTLGVLFIEAGAVMALAIGRQAEPEFSWFDAVQHSTRRSRELLRLARTILLRGLLLLLPGLIALAAIYLLLLGDFDINYYLTERPPEFQRAIVLAVLVSVINVAILLTVFTGWIFALPMVLFEGQPGHEALSASSQATRAQRGRLTLGVLAAIAAAVVVTLVTSFVLGRIATSIVPMTLDHPALAATGLAIAVAVLGLGGLAVSVALNVLAPLLVVRLHETFFGLDLARSPGCPRPAPASQRRRFSAPIPVLVLAAAALVIAGAYTATRGMGADQTAEIIAHRGAAADAPENTLAAFSKAIDDQTDWIELDVQEGADGRILVAHDSDFMKVAGDPLKVWEATPESLRDLDIGSWFGPGFAAERTPTLREALELARGRARVLIELKYYGHQDRLEERVIDVVEGLDMSDQVAVMSLKLDGVRALGELRPDWRAGLLNTAALGDLTQLDLDFLALNSAATTRRMVRQAHRHGVDVYVWTVNDPVQMSIMLSRGVDGIITDRPNLVRRVMELRSDLSPFGRILVWIAGESGLLPTTEPPSDPTDA